ncbi:hypothetical protein [Vibrio phage RYC]|nr:hypothetical protein [Vibrio phage RYC]
MLFKIREKDGKWWTYDKHTCVMEEEAAFVFDSDNEDHINNLKNDYIKESNILKIVVPKEV